MSFSRPIAIGLVLLAAQLSAGAAELAVLRNGFSIPFVRKEQNGTTTRLFTATGFMDVPTADIVSFEKDEAPPAAAPVAMTSLPNEQAAQRRVSLTESGAAPGPAPAAAPVAKEEIDQAVREASSRHQLDPDFVNSVIKAESNFYPRAVSRKGAQGLMQLMPQTASKLGVADPFDPKSNIEAGTAHLSALMDMYHNDPIKALAAYNAGAHRVQQYHGVPPYRETRAYVARIVRDFNAKKRAQMQNNMAKAPAKSASPDKTGALSKAAASNGAAASKNAAASNKPAKKKPVAPRPQQASVQKPNKPA